MTEKRGSGGLVDLHTGEYLGSTEQVAAALPVEGKTETQRMLALRDAALATDYDYMPIRSKDISQAISIAIQADAGVSMMAKAVLGGIGAMTGGPIGTGLGWLIADAGMDIYEYNKVMGRENFWEDFMTDMKEVGQSDSAFSNFAEGLASGGSFIGGGEDAAYMTYEDMLGKQTAGHAFGNLAGLITTDMAASFVGGPYTMAGASALRSGMQEYQREVGMGMETWDAVKSGAIVGVATGATGALFMGLVPSAVTKMGFNTMNGAVGTSMGYLGAGAEFAAWGATHDAFEQFMRGEDVSIDAGAATAGFIGGLALHGGAKGVGKLASGVIRWLRGTDADEGLVKEMLQIEYKGSTPKQLEYKQPKLLDYANSNNKLMTADASWNYANKVGRQAAHKELHGEEAKAFVLERMKLDGVLSENNATSVFAQINKIFPNYYIHGVTPTIKQAQPNVSKHAWKFLDEYTHGNKQLAMDVISRAEKKALSRRLGIEEIKRAVEEMSVSGTQNIKQGGMLW